MREQASYFEVATWVSESLQEVSRDQISKRFVYCGILGHQSSVNNQSVHYEKLHSRLRCLVDSGFAYVPSSDEEEVVTDMDEGSKFVGSVRSHSSRHTTLSVPLSNSSERIGSTASKATTSHC